jgi:hypothetical protein
MGMFDEITCKTPLPLNEELKRLNVNWNEIVFQTKDLDNCLNKYTITEDGELIENIVEYKYTYYTEEEKKSNKNLKAWDIVKDQKIIKEYSKTINYHGTVVFYDILEFSDVEDVWVDFKAYFVYGKLDKIEIDKIEKHPSRKHNLDDFLEKDRQLKNSFQYKCKTYLGWFWFWKNVGILAYKLSNLCSKLHSSSIRKLQIIWILLSINTISAQTTQNVIRIPNQEKHEKATFKVELYKKFGYVFNLNNIIHDDLDGFKNPIKTSNIFTTLEIEF